MRSTPFIVLTLAIVVSACAAATTSRLRSVTVVPDVEIVFLLGEPTRLLAPAGSMQWRLSGLESLAVVDPPEGPAQAWLVRGRTSGEGTLTLEADLPPPPCPEPPNCPPPPAPPRLSAPFRVR